MTPTTRTTPDAWAQANRTYPPTAGIPGPRDPGLTPYVIGFGSGCIAGCQPRQQPVAKILQRARMAQSRLVSGGAGGDFQRLDGGFLSRLQALGRGRLKPPIASAIFGVRGRDIGEGGVQRFGHPLRRTVRNAELGADVLKADAAAPGGGHLGKTEQILSLGKRHLTSMPEIDTIITY